MVSLCMFTPCVFPDLSAAVVTFFLSGNGWKAMRKDIVVEIDATQLLF